MCNRGEWASRPSGQDEVVVKQNKQMKSRIQEAGYSENPEEQDSKTRTVSANIQGN